MKTQFGPLTLSDLGAYLDMLTGQITADIQRHRALTQLHDMTLATGATPDARLFDVLSAIENPQKEVA